MSLATRTAGLPTVGEACAPWPAPCETLGEQAGEARVLTSPAQTPAALAPRPCDPEEKTNEAFEFLARSMSHELRNPLNAIIGFATLLADPSSTLSASQSRQFAAHIRASGLYMGALCDGLLKLSRVRQRALQRREVDLSAMAREIVERLRAETSGRQVAVEIETGLVADGDEDLLHIALSNLLGNAWKYTGTRTDAHIEFGAGVADAGRVYAVRDNGAGFDMARARQLFEPFHRLHSQADFPGTGLGLSIVHRIIRQHGGRIWADACAGQGACFQFTLGPS